MKRKLILLFLPFAVYWMTRLLYWSLRKQAKGYESLRAEIRAGRPFIAAIWHSRILLMPRFYHEVAYRPAAVIISKSFDGQLAGAFGRRYGLTPIWGSSSRGGAEALEQLIESSRQGLGIILTADGPRGPAQILKPGTIKAAQALGAPIYPATCHAEKVTRLRSWDRFVIPHPFSRAVFIVGKAVRVPPDADAAGLEAKRRELEDELNRITQEAEHYFDAGAEPDH